jgi:Family of unknown function (DUF5996)
MPDNTSKPWPPLPYEEWKDTYATLHMWTQIVGKIALASAPALNHSWAIALRVTPRGLATRRLFHGDRTFAMEFDFIDHQLVIRSSDGSDRTVRLEPRTVADFYQEVMNVLREMGLAVTIWTLPAEIASPIRFEDDTTHRSYNPVFANRCWRILAQIDEVFTREQCAFIGKCSPTHFFWGGFDLAVTRFSGRPAPPREGPAFMREAYSREVISHGFWPGSAPVLEPAFYAYAAPEPLGFNELKVQPDAAFYHRELGEFILPYESVRTASSPEAAIRAFVESTYEGAADLAHWDRQALERVPV